jgi:hypothetical protein
MYEVTARSALDLAREAAAALRGTDGKTWVTRLENEFANLESALDSYLQEDRMLLLTR